MNKIEYKREYITPEGGSHFEDTLNFFGQDGWDAFFVERSQSGGYLVYLKKVHTSKYTIPQEEYDYIEAVERDSGEPCQLCGYIYGDHSPQCPSHEDNKDKSGVQHCFTCGWIFDGKHTNKLCDDYEEEENED